MRFSPAFHTIKHECHHDPLTLEYSLEDDLKSDEWHCDFCETKRDPNQWVYYCAECSIPVHLSWVYPCIGKVTGLVEQIPIKMKPSEAYSESIRRWI
jgi:hypothetical protein